MTKINTTTLKKGTDTIKPTNNESEATTMKKTTIETVNNSITKLNQLISDGVDYTNIITQIKVIEEQIKEVNTDITDLRINELLEMDTTAMFNEFIDHRFVMLKKLALNAENNIYSMEDVQRQLSFVQLQKASKKEICKGIYEKLTAIFMDNLYRNIKADLSVEGIKVDAPVLNSEYTKLRTEHKFTELSGTQLEKQLNTILSFLLPADIEIKAIKADAKYL